MQGNVNSFGQRDGSPAQLAGSLPSFDQHYPQDIRPNTGNSQMIDSLSMNHFSNQNTGGGSDQASLDENVSTLYTTAYSNFLTDITWTFSTCLKPCETWQTKLSSSVRNTIWKMKSRWSRKKNASLSSTWCKSRWNSRARLPNTRQKRFDSHRLRNVSLNCRRLSQGRKTRNRYPPPKKASWPPNPRIKATTRVISHLKIGSCALSTVTRTPQLQVKVTSLRSLSIMGTICGVTMLMHWRSSRWWIKVLCLLMISMMQLLKDSCAPRPSPTTVRCNSTRP